MLLVTVLKRISHSRLQRHSLIYFVSKVIPGAMGLLSVTVFVRLVGYAEYGRYAVILSMLGTLSALAVGWLNPGILRFLSNCHTSDDERTFRSAVITGVVLSTIVGCAGGGAAIWIFVEKSRATTFLAVSLAAALVAYSAVLATLQARLIPVAVVAMEAARTTLAFLVPVAIVFATGSRDHATLLVGALAGSLAPLAVYFGSKAFRKELAGNAAAVRATVDSRLPVLWQIWTYGWPIALWSLCNQGLSVADRYMIQHFYSYADAGAYAAVYDVVVRSLSLMFFPIALATHPIITKHWNVGQRAEALSVVKTSIKYQLYLCVPILLGWTILGRWFAMLVFGAQRAENARLILPLAVGGCLWQMSLLIQSPLVLVRHTKRMLCAMATALVAGLAADYVLIPRFGSVSAAYVNLATAAVYIGALMIVTPLDELRHQAREPLLASDETLAGMAPVS